MMNGKIIGGRYKIIRLIGGGGMANVYLAHDSILDREVALKMLRLEFASDEEFIQRFYREAQAATSLAHPNIVSIYDIGEEKEFYFIVMEYVEGQTLKEYIQSTNKPNISEVISIMKQLTSAISHAHQNHIIHRDIKPQNILIDQYNNVKITDFGIAMALTATSITQTNSVLGSVHYLSPEQARGGTANSKSDIYSLGIVMFELLTLRLPFQGESAVSIALKHLQSETPSIRRFNRDVPQSVENIVMKATAKDPFYRYQSVEEMEADLSTALNSERLNEEKFVVPVDHDATIAIPVITSETLSNHMDETIIHQQTNIQTKKLKNKEKKWRLPIILGSILTVLILFVLFIVFIYPKLFNDTELVVPDLTNSTLEDGLEKIESLGLKKGLTIEILDDEIEEGNIIKTSPSKDTVVKPGTTIDIYISLGKQKYEFLNYIDRNYTDVYKILEQAGFTKLTKKEVFDNRKAEGIIIAQNITSGEKVVPTDTEVVFTVSKGPEAFLLKDLRGFNIQSIHLYAETTGLSIEVVEERYTDEVDSGLVISQQPVANEYVVKGSTVKVVVSKGKQEVPPKSVTEEVTIYYEPIILGEPQLVQIFINDLNHTMQTPYDTFTITENYKIRLELLIPYGQKGEYMVILDNEVIIDKEIPYP